MSDRTASGSARLREVLRKKAGLAFEGDLFGVAERKLRERMAGLPLADLDAYASLLESDTPDGRRELDEALDIVTTHETYFFREEYQLTAFAEHILPELWHRGKNRVSVLSAGCSTGEEAVSIAISALRSSGPASELRILGVDLSRRCVQAARRAVYGKTAFRGKPELAGPPWFEEVPGGGLRPIERVRSMCTFTQGNLLEDHRLALGSRFDAIFCRNVLIYLEPAARAAAVSTLFERLAPSGYLLLGHSESLLHAETPFESVTVGDAIVYRRPE